VAYPLRMGLLHSEGNRRQQRLGLTCTTAARQSTGGACLSFALVLWWNTHLLRASVFWVAWVALRPEPLLGHWVGGYLGIVRTGSGSGNFSQSLDLDLLTVSLNTTIWAWPRLMFLIIVCSNKVANRASCVVQRLPNPPLPPRRPRTPAPLEVRSPYPVP